jgi:hypothetical protein
VATLVTRNVNKAMVALMVGCNRLCIWKESGVRQSVLCSKFDRNLVSVTMKMFSHLIYFMKKFYKFCTSNVICKYNAAIFDAL